MDVSNAFCYADIAGDVYADTIAIKEMEPECYYNDLHKSFYGLWSSPYLYIDKFIKFLNFQSCVLDPCLYYCYQHSKLALICVYVDDIIIYTSDMLLKYSNSYYKR